MGKSNGFLIFVNEYKKKNKVQYYNFRELLDSVAPFWNELSEREKERYKERAKADNKRKELKRGLNSSISEIESKKLKLEEDEYAKKQMIKDLVYTASDLGVLDDKVFHFVNISTYFEDENDIYPAELAIAKFSLRRGIFDTLHIKINPGELPVGAGYIAQEKANKTHKYLIPNCSIDDQDSEESSYVLILLKIIDFIDPLDSDPIDELPMFFTEGSSVSDNRELLHIQKALVRIFEKAGEYDIASDMKLYSIVDLFYYLNKVNSTVETGAFPSYPFADEIFRRTNRLFCYIAQGCDYHEEHDNLKFCCLSKVNCYGYIIAKYCVNPTKYPLIEGKHYPKKHQVAE